MTARLLILAQLLSLVPQQAWAAAQQLPGLPVPSVVSAPLAPLPAVPNLPTAGVPLAVSPAGQTSSFQVPLPPRAGYLETGGLTPAAKPEKAVAGHLAESGRAAAGVLERPSAPAGDSVRADFTLPRRERAAGEPVLAQPSPSFASSGLSAPGAPAVESGRPSVPPAPSAPKPPTRGPSGVKAYLSGVLTSQLANNAMTVTLPLVLLKLGVPLSTVAFITTVTTAMDMGGTLIGGRLVDRAGPKAALVGATVVRGAAMAAVAILVAAGAAPVPLVVGLFIADALARGVTDTARNTLPLLLVGKEKPALDSLNSKYQTAFEVGGVLGPLLLIPLLKGHALLANAVVAGGFALATAAFLGLPRLGASIAPAQSPAQAAPAAPAGRAPVLRSIWSDRWLSAAFLTALALALTPAFRSILPALFAEEVLHSSAAAASLVLAFGLGGTAGSLLYNRLHAKVSLPRWLILGAAGSVILSLGWLPAAMLPMAGAMFLFALTNVMVRLAVTSAVQERAKKGTEGGVMGYLRFTATLGSLGVRLLIGLAVAAVAVPSQAFYLIAPGIGLLAVLQVLAARKLRTVAAAAALAAAPGAPRPSPNHGYPGRLIVVEGLDGSGKSTQLDNLRQLLEAKGLKVVVTTWNSSPLISETVKKAKRERSLTPETFSILHGADLAQRLESVIRPALAEGAIVLADRWVYTGLARDRVRGLDKAWLRKFYEFAIKPDMALYFKLPVETAIGRVLARTEGRLELSEDFGEDGEKAQPSHGLKYYEAGLDVKLSPDPLENFKLFQTRVSAEYDGMVKEFGLRVVDATKSRELQREAVSAQVLAALGGLASFKGRDDSPEEPNLFDKDPATDSETLRRNYMREKKGVHFYFRNMLHPMRARFSQLVDHASMPRAVLHGNPHIDQYAKSKHGAAMVDFDRSVEGPYAWDLVRMMVSLSLRQKKPVEGFLEPEVTRQLLKGYLRGLRHPDRAFSEMRKLKDIEPEADEVTTDAYAAAGKKWVRELRKHPIPTDDPESMALLRGYLQSRGELSLLDEYRVEEAGKGFGSMGNGRVLLLLAPKAPGKDRILIEIKPTFSDVDTEWYKDPDPHHGKAMVESSALYAPGWEERPGFTTLSGRPYWGRQVHTQNVKLKKMLGVDDQKDLAYAVGTQLGRAHALSLKGGATIGDIELHLARRYDAVVAAGAVMKDELVAAHRRYLKKMKDGGLEPPDAEVDDE